MRTALRHNRILVIPTRRKQLPSKNNRSTFNFAVRQGVPHIMFPLEHTAGFIATLSIIIFVFVRLGRIGLRPKHYPLGPPTLPLIGNLHLIPKTNRHRQFARWAEEYGPVYSLMLGPKPMVVLSSDRAVKDLLDNRGAIYSSRPESYVEQDILSNGQRVLLMVSLFLQAPIKRFQ
jgi:hypothetical protein